MKTKQWFLYPLFAAMLLFIWAAPASALEPDVPVSSMTYAPGGMGDLLLGASYDVRSLDLEDQDYYSGGERQENWQNFLEFQNTSGDWVATHLRFREGNKSIEVWDHPILLSPYDVFWAYLMRIEDGGVMIASSDWYTLYNSGLISKDELEAQSVEYTGETFTSSTGRTFVKGQEYSQWIDTFKTDLVEQMTDLTANDIKVGEFEIIGMWSLNGMKTENPAAGFIHNLVDLGVTNDYDKDGLGESINIWDIKSIAWGGPRGDFPDEVNTISTVNDIDRDLKEVKNVLKGTMQMADRNSGQMMVYSLDAVQNFRTQEGTDTHRDGYEIGYILFPPDLYLTGGAFGMYAFDPIYTDDEPAWYLNPDWATVKGPTLRDGDAILQTTHGLEGNVDHNFNEAYSLYDVSAALAKGPIWSFYFNDDPFGNNMWIDTDFTITFPTKYLHYNINMPFWEGPLTFTNIREYIDAVDSFRVDVENPDVMYIAGAVWDTEQGFPKGETKPSPKFDLDVHDLPVEVNIERMAEFTGLDERTWAFGQATFSNWFLASSDRAIVVPEGIDRNWGTYEYAVPPIGFTTRIHTDGDVAYRSGSHKWQWVELDAIQHFTDLLTQ